MVSKWLGFSGVLFAGKNSYCRVTAESAVDIFGLGVLPHCVNVASLLKSPRWNKL
jgi:hypothetical protein